MAEPGPQVDLQHTAAPDGTSAATADPTTAATNGGASRKKSRWSRDAAAIKRRCVSTACIACRRRKSKCDGNTPSCAACSSVYGTECVYDPNSDHRRKGVYKEKIDSLKTRNSTLQTLIQAILNAAEDDVQGLVRQIRTCESLDDVAENILKQEQGIDEEDEDAIMNGDGHVDLPTFELELSSKMGEMRIENGSVRFIGGTSNLIYLSPSELQEEPHSPEIQQQNDPLTSWTEVTKDTEVIVHLINMYFTWHYPYFTTLSKSLFYRDFLLGKPPGPPKRTVYCSSLLVNAMLALGCHFTNSPAGCQDPNDSTTKGDAFFQEAKRLIIDNDEYEKPRLTTVQALGLMSVREAGCGREAKGWVYSGMSFRMAQDMGLNLDSGGMTNSRETMDEQEIDARRVTFWGCYLFDKCWSNYLGRLPQLPTSNITVAKFDVFPDEDSDIWSPYTDNGVGRMHSQPSRTRTVALQISELCEISSDLLIFFYHPQQLEKTQGRAAELKKLGELHTRLEAWRKDLPKELEPKEGQLPNVLLMHMFFHLLYIHLFRPFLRYNPATSPLPSHVSPRKLCTQAASLISKLMRLYKRTYGLRQICNIAVYMVHSACTIHLLNLPEKTARRDIVHGLKHLEEIAEDWLCARRTLSILFVLARKWKITLPDEATNILVRTDAKYGSFSTADVPSPAKSESAATPNSMGAPSPPAILQVQSPPGRTQVPAPSGHAPSPSRSYNPNQTQTQYYIPQDQTARSVTASPQISVITQNYNGMLSGGVNNSSGLPPQQQQQQQQQPPRQQNQIINSSRPNSGISDSHIKLNNAFAQRHPFGVSRQGQLGGVNGGAGNGASTSGTLTRQVSPSMMFGGVDALVESQDWWLRDQASLVVGFENWDGPSPGPSNGTNNANINPTMQNGSNNTGSGVNGSTGNNINSMNNQGNLDGGNGIQNMKTNFDFMADGSGDAMNTFNDGEWYQ